MRSRGDIKIRLIGIENIVHSKLVTGLYVAICASTARASCTGLQCFARSVYVCSMSDVLARPTPLTALVRQPTDVWLAIEIQNSAQVRGHTCICVTCNAKT